MVRVWKKIRGKIVEFIKKLLLLRASPHQIAIGFAIGVFVGIFPTFGLGALFILAIASMWKFNVPAAILGTFIGNPLFAPIWITLSCLITGISPAQIKVPQEPFSQILAHYSLIGLRYLIGNFGVSLVVAIASYFILVRAVRWFRDQKKTPEE